MTGEKPGNFFQGKLPEKVLTGFRVSCFRKLEK
jgi:hypothetical protein